MRTLAVIALKGGSGKTTVATHLALAGSLRGLDTVFADIDPQRSGFNIMSAREGGGPICVPTTGAQLLKAKFEGLAYRRQFMVIDTAAGFVEDASETIVLADLTLLVVRPTLIDLSGLAPALSLVRKLGKPSLVVMTQAPVAREGSEAPLVRRAMRALDYMQAVVAPTVLRSRVVYQVALETGRSAEEMSDPAAAREVALLWRHVAGELGVDPELVRRTPERRAAT